MTVQPTNSAAEFCKMLLHAPATRRQIMKAVLDDTRQWLEVWEQLLTVIEDIHSCVLEKLRMRGYAEDSMLPGGRTVRESMGPFNKAEALLRLHLSNMILEIWNV